MHATARRGDGKMERFMRCMHGSREGLAEGLHTAEAELAVPAVHVLCLSIQHRSSPLSSTSIPSSPLTLSPPVPEPPPSPLCSPYCARSIQARASAWAATSCKSPAAKASTAPSLVWTPPRRRESPRLEHLARHRMPRHLLSAHRPQMLDPAQCGFLTAFSSPCRRQHRGRVA